ncbi:MAG: MFS transporter, partial [Deltaproteobacteria bacterium]|nr:MFS transporter [Deltaproteobacteria bacterium]
GFIVAPLAAEVLLRWVSWRGVMMAIGCISLTVGLAFARFGRGSRFRGHPPNLAAIKQMTRQRSFWVMAALFSLGLAGTNGIFSMLPLYLVSQHGLARQVTNLLVALSRISGLGMVFLAGWASDRLGPRRALAGVLAINGVLTVLLGLTSEGPLLLLIFLQPAIASCFFPPAFAELSRTSPPKARSLAVSLTVPAAFMVGSGVIPAGIGLAGQAGSFGAGIVVVGGMILAGLILLPGLRSVDQLGKEV